MNKVDRDKVREMIEEKGLKDSEVAVEMGCSLHTVKMIKRELGLGNPKSVSIKTLYFVRELIRNKFLSLGDMQRKVGDNANQLYRILRHNHNFPVFKKKIGRETIFYIDRTRCFDE